MNIKILRYDSLDSTNREAAEQARRGALEGTCVIARQQTAGRGRHGRNWVSDKDAGLYLSIVLSPRLDVRSLPLITLMSGVAACDTLREFGLNPDLKWVNDLYVGEKKLGGILAETAETPSGLAVIVGIGINLTSRNFPAEIADTATSIEAEIAKNISPDELAESLLRYLTYFYEILKGKNGNDEILKHWQRRSSYFSGKRVRVTLPDRVIEGVTDGLEENGALRVKTADGNTTIVQAGDVERLRTEMYEAL